MNMGTYVVVVSDKDYFSGYEKASKEWHRTCFVKLI